MPQRLPITDAEFNAELDKWIEATRAVVNKEPAETYFTTVFVICPEQDQIHVLSGADDDDEDVSDDEPADPIQLCRQFGERLGQRHRMVPQAVFVAGETVAGADGELIVISGATPDGRRNLAYLTIRRDKAGRITVQGDADRVYCAAGEPEISDQRNPSAALMAGMLSAIGRRH